VDGLDLWHGSSIGDLRFKKVARAEVESGTYRWTWRAEKIPGPRSTLFILLLKI
jgi:hypothetical protein